MAPLKLVLVFSIFTQSLYCVEPLPAQNPATNLICLSWIMQKCYIERAYADHNQNGIGECTSLGGLMASLIENSPTLQVPGLDIVMSRNFLLSLVDSDRWKFGVFTLTKDGKLAPVKALPTGFASNEFVAGVSLDDVSYQEGWEIYTCSNMIGQQREVWFLQCGKVYKVPNQESLAPSCFAVCRRPSAPNRAIVLPDHVSLVLSVPRIESSQDEEFCKAVTNYLQSPLNLESAPAPPPRSLSHRPRAPFPLSSPSPCSLLPLSAQ